MSLPIWLVAALLVGAAAVVAWPVRSSRRRRRALLGAGVPGEPALTPHDGESFRTAPAAFLASGSATEAPETAPPVGAAPAAVLASGPATEAPETAPPVGAAPAAVVPPGPRRSGRAGPSRLAPAADRPCTVAVAVGGPMPAAMADGRLARPAGALTRPPSFRPPGRRDSRRPLEPLRLGAGGIRRLHRAAGSDGVRAADTAARWSGALATGRPSTSVRAVERFRGLRAPLVDRPRRTLLLVGLVAAALGGFAAGPVAGVLLGGYGALGARAVLRRRAARQAVGERRRRLDQLCGLAADLRAGLPVPTPDDDGDRLASLTRAAVRLADRTGAPLAELLERVEADARALDRGLAAASAQAAGARATALLLAALPLGGIGLGYGIGADPVAVLLYTPVGAVSALTAMGLQIGGLLWAERLGGTPDASAR
ncbi:Flp pilus assembly protein TadB [Micromonospora purpureochromogenes]|uniref:Flp pilus assembly protein TadB n=1 Tax=Micromonospora purpureochromogenes TaxID=47872 RepID=A0A1C4U2T1_9ACTN|nr:hypothetical protein [Micromonospora purpureochromogenes]SCE66013.1 Flp pilus assembly protein TadB [Micromonospora purpureochromogenes]